MGHPNNFETAHVNHNWGWLAVAAVKWMESHRSEVSGVGHTGKILSERTNHATPSQP